MTTVRPCRRAGQGSASTSVCALGSAACPRAGLMPPSGGSCGVRRVLVHVCGGEVVGADERGGTAGVQVDADLDVACGHVDEGAVVGSGTATTDPHVVDGDVDRIGVER